ncbi:tudor domain-containing protein 1 isoform X2 [Anthonomus grandis grandis]|uniref:tudor domain-containing protein 1 isoform X2 n=1 Tax=Anthonomus grandis grandis TaxID=2921223 RepID=UPI002166A3FE|nr:tudor domain-containing protein 1 isoform X2 [Anthonomus grandis grandis]
MEKPRNNMCVWVNGNPDDLNRAILKEQFQKFGKVTKIFIDTEASFAKVYFDNIESRNQACSELSGFQSWKCSLFKENFSGKKFNSHLDTSYQETKSSPSDTHSIPGTSSDMETFFDAGEFVDINGRSVEVLQADNGQLFVSYDDIRAGGFNIYPKETYASTIILKSEDLRHFENFLLNQGQRYILSHQKRFSEEEMLNVFERVRSKWTGRSQEPEVEVSSRKVISDPIKKNFSITAPNVASSSSGRGKRPGRMEDLQPTYSYRNSRPLENRNNQSVSNGYVRSSSHNSRHIDDNRSRNNRRPDNASLENQNLPPRKPRSGDNVPIQTNHGQQAAEPTQESDEKWDDESIEPQNSQIAKNDSRKPRLNIKKVELDSGTTQKLKVSFINKKAIFCGNTLDSLDLIQEIFVHVNTIDNGLPEMSEPKRDMLCCAFFEDCWYRAAVLQSSAPDQTLVELIDYGNRERITTPVRELSEEMKAIPGQAIRCTLNNQECFNLTLDQVVEVYVRKHFDDLTHLVDIKQVLKADADTVGEESRSASDPESKSKPVVPEKEETFTKVPPTDVKIAVDSSVQIVNYTDSKLILRNKETALVCKNVYGHIATMPKKPITNPVVGQICLCKKDSDDGLHRAVIKKITDKTAQLEYLDHGDTVTLSLKSLNHVDSFLADQPRSMFEHPYPVLRMANEEVDHFLLDLIVEKKKLKTVNTDNTIDFQLADGTLLSEKIKSLATPPPPQTSSSPPTVEKTPEECKPTKKSPTPVVPPTPVEPPTHVAPPTPVAPPTANRTEIRYDDMPYVEVPLGKGQFTCYSCNGESLTLVSLSDQNVPYLSRVLDIAEPSDQAVLEPEPFQMCLAKFQDAWYRALIVETKENKVQVLFVDFGNSEDIFKTDIRSLPESLATVPIIGINASFDGLPDKQAVSDRLKELCADDTELEVILKRYVEDEMKYLIEIPSVYEQLREEGLL